MAASPVISDASPLFGSLPGPAVVASTRDPARDYSERLSARRGSAARLQTLSDRLATARGAVFLAAVVLTLVAWNLDATSYWWLAMPAALFGALVVAHDQVERRRKEASRGADHYQSGLDRLNDDWVGRGSDGSRYLDADHPYAADLDVFGRGSLFQLICRARTRLGEDTLARWLSVAADVQTIRARQRAIESLRDELDLREELAIIRAEPGEDIDQKRLVEWAAAPPRPIPAAARAAAVALSVVALSALAGWLAGKISLSWVIAAVLAEFAFLLSLGGRVRKCAEDAEMADSGLRVLSRVLRVFEERRFDDPLLCEQSRKIETEGRPPSRWIARLNQRIHFLQTALQNQGFAPIALLLCLPLHFAHAIESWRRQVGPSIAAWLDAVGTLEAVSSLAGYAFENPADPFPELVEEGPRLIAEEITHPLLPRATAVRNSAALGDGKSLLLVSGSNMSGKSTFLRTVGVNVVLALAGAPVRARRLVVSPLQVGSEMRVTDSLQQGQSLFFAVIRRLKRIVDLARGAPPLLFLLDEILQGTNSHDRRHGAEGVIRTLIDAGAVGLVTTHDLALTEIARTMAPRAENVHFEDRLEDGRMSFDYQLRPGVVQRSNALELMRLMGLTPGE